MLPVNDRDMLPLFGNIQPKLKAICQAMKVMRSSTRLAEKENQKGK